MGGRDSGYQLGTSIGEEEVARLEAQGAAMAPATRMIFAEAGIRIAFLVEAMRVAAPLIVGTGVATAEEIGMETFEQRLRDEGRKAQAVDATYMLLSAWATTSPE